MPVEARPLFRPDVVAPTWPAPRSRRMLQVQERGRRNEVRRSPCRGCLDQCSEFPSRLLLVRRPASASLPSRPLVGATDRPCPCLGNPRPEIVGMREKKAIYPANYDDAAEERVMAARDAILERGVAAFPDLIRHIDDERYSYTTRGDPEHISVGKMCHFIMSAQVEVYHGFTSFGPGRVGPTFVPRSKREAEEWWKQRRDKTLRDLQLEAVSLALDAARKKSEAPPAMKESQIAGLERLLKRLESSNDPIRVNSKGSFVSDKELRDFPGS